MHVQLLFFLLAHTWQGVAYSSYHCCGPRSIEIPLYGIRLAATSLMFECTALIWMGLVLTLKNGAIPRLSKLAWYSLGVAAMGIVVNAVGIMCFFSL